MSSALAGVAVPMRRRTLGLIGKVPTIAAWAHRHAMGLHYTMPDNELSYPANFLMMMFKQWEEMLLDPEQKIARPRQVYVGHDARDVPAKALAPAAVASR